MITPDLSLSDHEGALLTVGYTVRSLCLSCSYCALLEAPMPLQSYVSPLHQG